MVSPMANSKCPTVIVGVTQNAVQKAEKSGWRAKYHRPLSVNGPADLEKFVRQPVGDGLWCYETGLFRM